MRVELKANGQLTVYAQTEIESYALKKWSDSYFDESNKETEESLLVSMLEIDERVKREEIKDNLK